jgi:DNA-binding CsgD family transcriptional regulator
MEKRDWLTTTNDPVIQEGVRKKIEALQLFEKEIPAVFIVHDLSDFSVVYMSQRGLDFLGVQLEDVRLGNKEYHDRYFNPEDAQTYVPKVVSLIERNNDELVSFFQQVRPSVHHEWSWYLSSTKIFLRDNQGKPLLTITMAVPMAPEHHFIGKIDRLLEENYFLLRNQKIFASLTTREKEVLKLMALSVNSSEIAERLHISEATANTHRRNVRSKINAQSNYDITRFAQAFNLI